MKVGPLSVVVILTLNPAELLRQSRDANRLSDLTTMNSAINLYNTDQSGTPTYSLGTPSTTSAAIVADQAGPEYNVAPVFLGVRLHKFQVRIIEHLTNLLERVPFGTGTNTFRLRPVSLDEQGIRANREAVEVARGVVPMQPSPIHAL